MTMIQSRLNLMALLLGMTSALAGQCTPPTSLAAGTSTTEPVILSNFVNTKTWTGPMYAFNLSAGVTWQDCASMMMTRPATASTMLVLGPVGNDYQVQEIDASGNVVRQRVGHQRPTRAVEAARFRS